MSLFWRKTCLTLILIIIVTSFSFGAVAMDIDEKGDMSDCPFMDVAAICSMSFAEHIVIFLDIFRATPAKTILLIILALVVLLTLFKIILRIYLPSIKLKLFVRNNLEIPIFNKFLLALSNGIIQPKLYA